MIVLIGLRWRQGRLPELETTLRRMVSFRAGGDVESRGEREHLLDAGAGK
jgi:hypothetical protein